MEIFFFWLLFSVAVGILAGNRGRSGVGWFLLSMVISPLLGGLFCLVSSDLSKLAVITAPSSATHLQCPHCAEFVLPAANVCKHCNGTLTPQPNYAADQAREDDDRESRVRLITVSIVVVVSVIIWALVAGSR